MREKGLKMSMTTSLPEELVVEIIARVGTCNYPKLSVVSKHLRSLVASPELFARRSLLGRFEHCVYTVLYNHETREDHLYILRRGANNMNRLVLITSLPAMPPNASFIARGARIYVFDRNTSTGLSIDCRYHTVHSLPSLPMPMKHTFAYISDGKIYVVRLCDKERGLSHKVVVFDTETQMWEPEMTQPDTKLCSISCAVRSDKWKSRCVVDNVRYNYHADMNKLRAYDPKQRRWTDVKGVENLLHQGYNIISFAHTVNYGGKLAVLLIRLTGSNPYIYIRCAEIALERPQQGEILGKVERCNVVLHDRFSIKESVLVTV